MNDILKQEESLIFKIILKIIKFLAWVYLAILLFIAISLPFYNYILVPLDKKITSDVSKYLESELIQAYNLDIDPTVKESYISSVEGIYQTIKEKEQKITPIPTRELIEIEIELLIRIFIVLFILAFIYKLESKKDD
ncbi:MAG: hypothetical protein ACO2ON_02595 [Candidatus Nanopusillus sp.]